MYSELDNDKDFNRFWDFDYIFLNVGCFEGFRSIVIVFIWVEFSNLK